GSRSRHAASWSPIRCSRASFDANSERLTADRKTLPAADFVAELRAEARRLSIDPTLAQSLKYGKADVLHVRRWAKDYFRYIEHDPQATAATLARCLDRELFLELSGHLARKTGF